MVNLRILSTPIRAKPVVLINLAILWGIATWIGIHRNPDRSFWMSLLIGLLAMILMVIADFGHALAHILSARYAGAPMKEIFISAGMPRTIYADDEVSPATHRLRALGGPVFNALGLLLSLAVYAVTSGLPVGRELATWSMIGHGVIFLGSLLPFPIVDGGTIMKWGMVQRGKTEAEADETLKRLNYLLGVLAVVIGAALLMVRLWVAGLIFLGVGAIVLAIGAGKIR